MASAKPRALWICTESTFASNPGTGFVHIPATEISLPDNLVEFIKATYQRPTLEGQTISIPGAQGGSFSFKVPVFGAATASASPSTAGAAPAWFTAVMKAAGYTEHTHHATTVATQSSASGFTLADTNTTDWSVGDLIGWANTAGKVEAARIVANVAGAVTVAPAFSGTPQNSDVILHAVTYTPPTAGTPLNASETASIVMVGDGWQRTFSGCSCMVKLSSVSAKGLPTWDVSVMFDRFATTAYAQGTEIATIANPSPGPVVAKNGTFSWGGSAVAASEFSFDPGLKVVEALSTTETHGRQGYHVVDVAPTCGFKPYWASTYESDAVAGTLRALLAQIGGAITGVVAIHASNVQTVKSASIGEISNGVLGNDVQGEVTASGVSGLTCFSIGLL